jgi:hypothetical protein
MLRVSVHEDGALCRLELAGKLAGPWVAETEQCLTLFVMRQQTNRSRREAGYRRRRSWAQAFIGHASGGSTLDRAEGVAMTALIEEITAKQPFTGPK